MNSVSGFVTSSLRCTAGSGVYSGMRSTISPSLGMNLTLGCGQSVPHSTRSGALSIRRLANGTESWNGAPAGTQSYALTVYDPDAPTGSGWWHWVAINIPATANSLVKGAGTADGKAMPAGSQQVRTDFGAFGFGGACPPVGDKPHRYIFTLYALKVPKLEVAADSTAALAGFMIHGNMLAQTSFTAYYGR